MTRLHLLRHGQTTSNVSGSLDTAVPGADLTPLGVRQAEAAATRLADVPIGAIAVSRLVRTQQTAAPVAASLGLEPRITPGLEEISAGDLEMARDEESVRAWIRVVAAWLRGDLEPRMPGAETGHEFLARYDAAIGSALEPAGADGGLLVVSHGAAIRVWAHLRVADAEAMPPLEDRIDNTGTVVVELPEGAAVGERSWRFVDAHLDPLGGDLLSDHSEHDPTGDPL